MSYTTPQINAISDALLCARQEGPNKDYYIRMATDELPGLDTYVRGLEESNATYVAQLARLRDEVAKLRRRAA